MEEARQTSYAEELPIIYVDILRNESIMQNGLQLLTLLCSDFLGKFEVKV